MFTIAEIGQAHEGSLGIAHSYIDALADTGVDAIKFQTHIADAESSEHEPFRVNFSYEDPTRYNYWKRMEFSLNQWVELKEHCDEKGVEFISSPFSNSAVDILEEVGVQRYKIGSGEVNNHLLLRKIAETGKPIILSSGLSSFDELANTLEFLDAWDNEVSILQCTTAYPTSPEQWGLNLIQELKDRFGKKVGFSDHSGDITACIAASMAGAQIFEFHAVFDKRLFGPDSKASLTMEQISSLINHLKRVEIAKTTTGDKNITPEKEKLKSIFEKSLAVNRDIKKGERISFDMLEGKKPKGFGIDAEKFNSVIGKRVTKDLGKWDFLTEDMISE